MALFCVHKKQIINDIKVCINTLIKSHFHVSASTFGKRNFRKFPVPNERGQWEHDKLPDILLEREYDYPVQRDSLHIRHPGVWFGRKFYHVPEMEPQLIVPDLTDFALKPYVSYRTPDITQSEFTARDLFNATYADDIIDKFKNGKEEPMTVTPEDVEQAKIKARQTGADIFIPNSDYGIQN